MSARKQLCVYTHSANGICALAMVMLSASPTLAECTIVSPTPQNALVAPNGRIGIRRAFDNGQLVDVSESKIDTRGLEWVYATTLDGHPIGWIAGKYVICK